MKTMSVYLVILLGILCVPPALGQSSVAGWDIYDNTPPGTVDAVNDNGSAVFQLENGGQGQATGYRFTFANSPVSGKNFISWQMKYSEDFIIYVTCNTSAGSRSLSYRPLNTDALGTGGEIKYGLGTAAKSGGWVTIERNLQQDITNAQPGVTLLSVSTLLVRGSGMLDTIKLKTAVSNATPVLSPITVTDGATADTKSLSVTATDSDSVSLRYQWSLVSGPGSTTFTPDNTASSTAVFSQRGSYTVKVDVTDGVNTASANVDIAIDNGLEGWDAYDNNPPGTISVVDDSGDSVIMLDNGGKGMDTGYRYTFPSPVTGKRYVSWRMKYSEEFRVYLRCTTSAGNRSFIYTVSDTDDLLSGAYIHHGLDETAKAGSWITIERDLQRDLENAEPGETLISVIAFMIRGSGLVDDIILSDTTSNAPPLLSAVVVSPGPVLDARNLSVVATDSDSYSLRYNWSQTSGPGSIIFGSPKGTATSATFSLAGDYTVKLEVTDGISTVSSKATISIAGGLEGWDVYDNNPPGTITVVDDGGEAVVRLDNGGQGIGTGYRYTFPSPVTGKRYVSWRMKYSEEFRVYLRCTTSAGNRSFIYTVSDTDDLLSGAYIHHGLDETAKAGSWITIERDLQRDLENAEPGETLISVIAFMIRGSGLVDDIILSDTTSNAPPLLSAVAVSPGGTPGIKTLSGSAVDVDSYSLRYRWSVVSGTGVVTFSDITSPVTSGSFSLPGDYTIQLAVTDGINTVTANADVTVAGATPVVEICNPYVLPPVDPEIEIELDAPQSLPVIESVWVDGNKVRQSNAVGLHVLANDPQGKVLTYSWVKERGPGDVEFSANDSADANDTMASFSKRGKYRLSVVVVNADGEVASDTIKVRVK